MLYEVITDLVADLNAGRTSFSAIKDDDLPAKLRAMKPEERTVEVNRQMASRKALNEKLSVITSYSIHYTKLYDLFMKT